MALEYIQLLNDTKCSIFTEYTYPTVLWGDNYPNSDQKATFYAYFQTRNFNFWIDGEYTYDFGAFTLIHKVQSSNNNEWITVKRKSDNATLVSWQANNGSGRRNLESYISFAVDRDSELGYIFLGSCQTISYNSNKWQYYIGSGSLMSGGGTNDLYNVLLESSIPPNGGGAGSGYIGNSLVSNKKMVGYNVPTSSAESTKTESVNEASADPVSGKPKSGNGFARIKFLREVDISNMTEWTPDADFGWSVTYDDATKENHIYGQGNEYWEYFECPISVKKNTDYVLSCQYKGTGITYSTSNRDYLRIFNRFVAESEIRNNNGLYGISGLTITAESSDYFDNNSTYRNISVSFNSGNLSEVWACIGFGYGDYDANIFDVYFKNIQLTEV